MKLSEVIKVVGPSWSQYAVSVFVPWSDSYITHTCAYLSEMEDFISVFGMGEQRVASITPFDSTAICFVLDKPDMDVDYA